MRHMVRHLQLLPHGDRLLTSSAGFWFFSARVLVLTMALAEAVAWSYLGFLFGEGWTRVLVAAFTGGLIFLVVWMVDVSLITLDRAWPEHAAAMLGQEASSPGRRKLREAVTFGVRILVLIGSLTITAPYLAQLVFHKDIERHIAAQATKALEVARADLAEKQDAELRGLGKELELRRVEHEREVAGQGPSRRFGRGPTSDAMLRTISKLERQSEELREAKESQLTKFDALAADWVANRETLAAMYNVVVARPSILENRRALEALRERPEHQSTERAIKAFLGFIFAGMFLLKLFEPNSVRLYLSEVLQQEYNRYLIGTFDELLPVSERSTANPRAMSPQRLYDFLSRVWSPARRLEADNAATAARVAMARESLVELERMRSQVERERGEVSTEFARRQEEADDAIQGMAELESAMTAVQRDIDTFQSDLATAGKPRAGLDEQGRLEYENTRLEYRSSLKLKLTEANRALRELRESVPIETERCRRTESALKDVEVKRNVKQAELEEADRRLREVREVLADVAGRRARTVFDAVG